MGVGPHSLPACFHARESSHLSWCYEGVGWNMCRQPPDDAISIRGTHLLCPNSLFQWMFTTPALLWRFLVSPASRVPAVTRMTTIMSVLASRHKLLITCVAVCYCGIDSAKGVSGSGCDCYRAFHRPMLLWRGVSVACGVMMAVGYY